MQHCTSGMPPGGSQREGFPPVSHLGAVERPLNSHSKVRTPAGAKRGVFRSYFVVTRIRGAQRRLGSVSDGAECLGGCRGRILGRSCADSLRLTTCATPHLPLLWINAQSHHHARTQPHTPLAHNARHTTPDRQRQPRQPGAPARLRHRQGRLKEVTGDPSTRICT